MNQPNVIIGARSQSRGQFLERRLREGGRLNVVGFFTRVSAIVEAMATQPTASLIVDSELQDGTGLDVIYQVLSRRPAGIVALISNPSGEYVVGAITAGAKDCVTWTLEQDGAAEVEDVVISMASSAVEPIRITTSSLVASSRRSPPARFPSGRLVVLVGSRRAALLCEAVTSLPGSFPGALICQQPISDTSLDKFVLQLDCVSDLNVKKAGSTSLVDGHAYLLQLDDTFTLDDDLNSHRLNVVHKASAGRQDSRLDLDDARWLSTLGRGIERKQLSVVIISSGVLSGPLLSMVGQLVDTGAALARSSTTGFKILWPGAQDSMRMEAREFWTHLSNRIVSRGFQSTLPNTVVKAAGPKNSANEGAR